MSFLLDVVYITLTFSSIVGAIVTTFDGGCTNGLNFVEGYVIDYVNYLEESESEDDEFVENEDNERRVDFIKYLMQKNMEHELAVTYEEIGKQFETFKIQL